MHALNTILLLSSWCIHMALAHGNCFADIIQSRGLERTHLERRMVPIDHGKDPLVTNTQDYSYDGSTGPQFWGQFNTTCSKGKYQSPVNFDRETASQLTTKSLPALQWPQSTNEALNFTNNGHTVMLMFGDLGLADLYTTVAPNNQTFTLVEMHFHNPSEHRVDSHGKHHSIDILRHTAKFLFRFPFGGTSRSFQWRAALCDWYFLQSW